MELWNRLPLALDHPSPGTDEELQLLSAAMGILLKEVDAPCGLMPPEGEPMDLNQDLFIRVSFPSARSLWCTFIRAYYKERAGTSFCLDSA